ncbi:MAG: hypothetical protein KDC44_01075 [Phaeodactylibacter sp.]|nr:hypothetical protein [Phaeodactylibacter sp.]
MAIHTKTLYYVNSGDGWLYSKKLDPAGAPAKFARVSTDSKCLQLSPDGLELYILDENGHDLFVVDLTGTAPVIPKTIDLKGKAQGCGCFVRFPK